MFSYKLRESRNFAHRFFMNVKKKCRECRGGTDGQLGVPGAKCGCRASRDQYHKAEQLGKAVAYGAEITQKAFNHIATTRSFMHAFRHELESFQCLFCQRR